MIPSWQEVTRSERGSDKHPKCFCCDKRKPDVGEITDEFGEDLCLDCGLNCDAPGDCRKGGAA